MDRSERVLVKYPLFKTAVARIQACFDSHDATAEPDCCPIVGESGSGKTTIISHFASLHPRVDHKWGLEVPVLVAKVPARPTVKSFAETLLKQWTAARDAEGALYMSRTEAKGALGLTDRTVAKVATTGAIRYFKGPEQNFPSGFFFFLREDVMKD